MEHSALSDFIYVTLAFPKIYQLPHAINCRITYTELTKPKEFNSLAKIHRTYQSSQSPQYPPTIRKFQPHSVLTPLTQSPLKKKTTVKKRKRATLSSSEHPRNKFRMPEIPISILHAMQAAGHCATSSFICMYRKDTRAPYYPVKY